MSDEKRKPTYQELEEIVENVKDNPRYESLEQHSYRLNFGMLNCRHNL